MTSILWLGVDGWPWAVVLAAKVSTGKTFLKPVEHYVRGYPFWDAVAWAVQAVDTPCGPRQGYEGVLEHVVVRFVARCSRICTHELVRHRLASYAQTSTRLGGFHATGYAEKLREVADRLTSLASDYCVASAPCPPDELWVYEESGVPEHVVYEELREVCVLPPRDWHHVAETCLRYLQAVSGLSGKEMDDYGRYAQPDALAAHIMVTTNLREALHILGLRLHPHAHWEIKSLAAELANRLWTEHRIPVHLMLALKRPGLAQGNKELRRAAEEQLEELRKHLSPENAAKIEQLYRSRCAPSPR